MKKFISGLIVFLVVLCAVLFFGRNVILKAGIETGTELALGLKLTIGKFDFNPGQSYLSINDLKVYNPRGFEEKILAEIPEIYVSYNLGDFFKKKMIHLNELRLNVQTVNIEKNKDGVSNIESLKATKKEEVEKKPAPEEKKKGEAPNFLIDKLVLTIRKVNFTDYSKAEVSEKDFDLRIKDKTFKNVDDLNTVVQIIVLNVLVNTSLGNLNLGVDSGMLSDQVNQTLEATTQMVQGMTGLGEGTMSSVVGEDNTQAFKDTTKEAASKVAETSKEAVDKLKGLFGGSSEE